MKYQIFVKTIVTEQITTHAIECYSFDTIHMLKKRIQEKSGIISAQQRLRFCGQILVEDPGKTLKDYEIGNGSTLECREPGGSEVSHIQQLARANRERLLVQAAFYALQKPCAKAKSPSGPKFRKK